MKTHPKSSQQTSVLLRTGLARPHPVLLFEESCTEKRETCFLFAKKIVSLSLSLSLSFMHKAEQTKRRLEKYLKQAAAVNARCPKFLDIDQILTTRAAASRENWELKIVSEEKEDVRGRKKEKEKKGIK